MAEKTDPLSNLDSMRAAVEDAHKAAVAELAKLPVDQQVAALQAEFAGSGASFLQRVITRATALPDDYAVKALVLQWADAGLNTPKAMTSALQARAAADAKPDQAV